MGRVARRALPLLILVACATPQEAVHFVAPGENLYRIAAHYRVPISEIARANGIEDIHDLEPGTTLRIPGAERPPPEHALRPPPGVRDPIDSPLLRREEPWVTPRSAAEQRAEALANAEGSGKRFAWPVQGRITSRYGRRGRRLHEGIDIAAPKGRDVLAAETGSVVFSGSDGSYGRVVVLDHGGRFRTLYAHNAKNRVRAGERVERGDVIAEVGTSGNATGPHLHFELRYDGGPRDPLLYLPMLTGR